MEEEPYQVFGEEHMVMTVYANAYMKRSGVDSFCLKQYGKDYFSVCQHMKELYEEKEYNKEEDEIQKELGLDWRTVQ